MIRDVLRMGDPRLWQKSLPVEKFGTPELNELLQDMRDTMAHLNGAGLAAPQIGVLLRVVIFGVHGQPALSRCRGSARHGADQPGASSRSRDEIEEGWEGCLSVPGMRGVVPRYQQLRYSRLRRARQAVRARRVRTSTRAWCSTSATTSTASSTRCASATSPASASTKRCSRGRSCRRKTSRRMPSTVFRKSGERVRLDEIPTEPPKGVTKAKVRERLDALGEELFELQDDALGREAEQRRWWCCRAATLRARTAPSSTSPATSTRAASTWRRSACRPPKSASTISSGACTAMPRASANSRSSTARTTRTCWWSGCTTWSPKKLWKAALRRTSPTSRSCSPSTAPSCSSTSCTSRKRAEGAPARAREARPRPPGSSTPTTGGARLLGRLHRGLRGRDLEDRGQARARGSSCPPNAKWYRNLVVAESIVEALRAVPQGLAAQARGDGPQGPRRARGLSGRADDKQEAPVELYQQPEGLRKERKLFLKAKAAQLPWLADPGEATATLRRRGADTPRGWPCRAGRRATEPTRYPYGDPAHTSVDKSLGCEGEGNPKPIRFPFRTVWRQSRAQAR